MKYKIHILLIMLAIGIFLVTGNVHGQVPPYPSAATPDFNCSPAPCVLPPTQASEGGSVVTDAPIVSDPRNAKHMLLGGFDGNCTEPSVLGFHLSTDGGSTWNRYCMPILQRGRVYWPVFDPLVGYDRNGTAYIAGDYGDSEGLGYGFVALQKSTDGIHWSRPVVALRDPGLSFPFETSMTVDITFGSPWLNTVYFSGVIWTDQGYKNQVLVSHSTDGGATWTQVAVDAVQHYPAGDDLTRITVGKDGTVYITWMRCPGTGPDKSCKDGVGHIMFSKSIDGGNTWSTERLITKVTMPTNWALPNTGQRVYNYPVIGVDNSKGPHSGNLYMAVYSWTGTYLRVQVIRSTDSGATWSKPVPVAPASDTHDQFFPALSVSPGGKVGVSWLDRRNDPADIDYQAFAAISTDGGRSFQPNWQLTTAFSNPDNNGTGNNWMGDYTGNTWAGEDFIAAWMDSSNGVDMQEVVGGIRLH